MALLELKIPSGNTPLPLATSADEPAIQPGRTATVFGYMHGKKPGRLQKAEQILWSDAQAEPCWKEEESESGGPVNLRTFLAAGAPEATVEKGDSGGPLVVGRGQYKLVGVTSTVAAPCPTLYADVGPTSRLRPWIETVIRPKGVSVGDVSVAEPVDGAQTAVEFTVRLTAKDGVEVRVPYSTVDGSAAAPADYIATSGVVVFPPGQRTRRVSVPIMGDAVDEPPETFFLRLDAPTGNAVILDGVGAATINPIVGIFPLDGGLPVAVDFSIPGDTANLAFRGSTRPSVGDELALVR